MYIYNIGLRIMDFNVSSLFKETCEMHGGDAVYVERVSDIATKCPFCGDSKHNRKRRLHLYVFNSDVYVVNCFNAGCEIQNLSFYNFLRKFNYAAYQRYRTRAIRGANTTVIVNKTLQTQQPIQPQQSDNTQFKQFVDSLSCYETDVETRKRHLATLLTIPNIKNCILEYWPDTKNN